MELLESSVKTLFLLFYEVWSFCEGYSSSSDSQLLFKSAAILEDTYAKLQRLGSLSCFQNKLNDFWLYKGLPLVPLIYFEKSTLSVISKYMSDNSFTDFEVKQALKEFLRLKSENDLATVVKSLHQTQKIVNRQGIPDTLDSVVVFEAQKCLNDLIKMLIKSNINTNETALLISQMLQRKTENVRILLQVLNLPQDSQLIALAQSLVADAICNLLNQPGNSVACLYLFEEKNIEHMLKTWDCFPQLLLNLFGTAIKRFKCEYSSDSYSWESEDEAISFEDIISVVTRLKNVPTMKSQLKGHLNKLRDEGFTLVVEDLLRICKIE